MSGPRRLDVLSVACLVIAASIAGWRNMLAMWFVVLAYILIRPRCNHETSTARAARELGEG